MCETQYSIRFLYFTFTFHFFFGFFFVCVCVCVRVQYYFIHISHPVFSPMSCNPCWNWYGESHTAGGSPGVYLSFSFLNKIDHCQSWRLKLVNETLKHHIFNKNKENRHKSPHKDPKQNLTAFHQRLSHSIPCFMCPDL